MLCISKIELRFSAIVAVICAAFSFSSCGDETVMAVKDTFYPKQLKSASKLRKLAFWAILLVMISMLYSCTDDQSITQPGNETVLDTISKYQWIVDTLYAYSINDLYAADTNDIFFSANPNQLHFDGTSYKDINLQDPGFRSYCVNGFRKNNIYFGGDNYGRAMLKMWDGVSSTSYTIPDDSVGSVNSIYVLGPDNLWISVSEKNFVYHFVTGNFEKYAIDNNKVRGENFYVKGNELFLFCNRYSNDTTYKYIYVLRNNSFIKLSEIATCGTCTYFYWLGYCKTDVLNVTGRQSFYFNGTDWSPNVVPVKNVFDTPPQYVSGNSKDDFFCFYIDGYPYINSLLLYRNGKWNWEKELNLTDVTISTVRIKVLDRSAYLILNAFGSSLFARGFLK